LIEESSGKPKVSIIIPTYNSEKTLFQCLKSVYSQSYPFYEVIIVDNYSTDGTLDIAKKFGAKIIQAKSNPATARNIGIANSTGKYVLFLDADQILSPSVTKECVEKCEKEEANMAKIPEVFIGKSFWSQCSALWKNCYQTSVKDKFQGEPRFFVKNRVIQAGMFNEILLWAEDYELYNRMKKFRFKETRCKSVIFHIEPNSVKKILLKLFRYGKSMPHYSKSTRQKFFPWIVKNSVLTFMNVLAKRSTNPLVTIGCIVLLFLKVNAIMLGLLKTYLTLK